MEDYHRNYVFSPFSLWSEKKKKKKLEGFILLKQLYKTNTHFKYK